MRDRRCIRVPSRRRRVGTAKGGNDKPGYLTASQLARGEVDLM